VEFKRTRGQPRRPQNGRHGLYCKAQIELSGESDGRSSTGFFREPVPVAQHKWYRAFNRSYLRQRCHLLHANLAWWKPPRHCVV